MSYYVLPRKQSSFKISPTYEKNINPIVSFSLLHYVKKAREQINILQDLRESDASKINIDSIYKIVNPYEFIHSKVPDSKFSVSKVKANSPSFYSLMEIINSFNIFEPFSERNINILYFGQKKTDAIMDCINIFRENNSDNFFEIGELSTEYGYLACESIDFLYIELHNISVESGINEYIIEFVNALYHILMYQNINGTCVIKLGSLSYKPILDIIYMLTSTYEKSFIAKPIVGSVFKNERFIICKSFTPDNKNNDRINILKALKEIIVEFKNDNVITSILNSQLPYYFLNKIEESNIIIGQQQLEHLDRVINIIKNKNGFEKMESLKKTNIEKCMQWCEKNKLPYNKFVDRLNIFLPIAPRDAFVDTEDIVNVDNNCDLLELKQ